MVLKLHRNAQNTPLARIRTSGFLEYDHTRFLATRRQAEGDNTRQRAVTLQKNYVNFSGMS